MVHIPHMTGDLAIGSAGRFSVSAEVGFFKAPYECHGLTQIMQPIASFFFDFFVNVVKASCNDDIVMQPIGIINEVD